MRSGGSCVCGCRHSPGDTGRWRSAESTGRSGTWFSAARRVTMDPAATRVSLLARAIALPALMAATVEARPLKPTIAVSTMSMLLPCTSSQTESIPANTLIPSGWRASATSLYFSSLQITTLFASNSRACRMSSSLELLAVSSSTSKRSLCWLITSRACLPMDPVDPNMAILLFPIRS